MPCLREDRAKNSESYAFFDHIGPKGLDACSLGDLPENGVLVTIFPKTARKDGYGGIGVSLWNHGRAGTHEDHLSCMGAEREERGSCSIDHGGSA